ncbi:Permease of the drug/metabolite transporter (DMT) superfamily [Hyphomicrobium sulfonivorans]|uniref:Permease of the drug/metabolite transporter (DMT) superfamily n=1 Tax=Hyphomicrobium sulfonivorans TaxID=121290 RepID=A0A125NUA2_HYPSL|nr:EamA family transporter [Hyphomicrobium sulfonivorans]KWT66015.1 Permease of the drug/metabolite transporter (DMT) superfamily [Hyphomicrobium sulfonivorans]
MPAKPLSLRDGLLALAVMAVWGSNFVVIRMGLDDLPPLLFAALRFTFVVFPAILFLKRPPVPWRNLAAYGLFIGAGQFGLLFLAMSGSITPGLASLVIQLQAFFTIGIAAAMTGEKVRPFQIAALLLAASGIGIILSHTDGSTTPLGLALVLSAALSWAIGNIVVRATPGVNMLAYVVWGSIFSAPPLYLMSLIFEGVPAIREGLANADINTAAVIAYQAIGNSLFGYAIWGWLLSRYPAATIAPMSLLVPVFGIAASALWLAEPLQDWKLGVAALVMAGLCLNVLWPRFAAIRGARTPPAA